MNFNVKLTNPGTNHNDSEQFHAAELLVSDAQDAHLSEIKQERLHVGDMGLRICPSHDRINQFPGSSRETLLQRSHMGIGMQTPEVAHTQSGEQRRCWKMDERM